MINIERSTLSEAWIDTLEAVLDAGGKAVNVVTSWQADNESVAVRDVLDTFIESRPQTPKPWPRWPVLTVANTIFADELYDPAAGDDALDQFCEIYLAGREIARIASPDGEYCERIVAWDGPDGETINQLTAVANKLKKYADANSRYRYTSDYEVAIEHPVLDLRTHMPGRNGSVYGFPCLSHLSLTVDDGVVHLTALYRNQHLIRKAYGNYLGLSKLARALCHHANLALGTVTVLATHADAELGATAGFGRQALTQLIADARTAFGRGDRAFLLSEATERLVRKVITDCIGIDAVDVAQFEADMMTDGVSLHGAFNDGELADAEGDRDRLAARFAVKEAVAKALGTGFRGIGPLDIAVKTTDAGDPHVVLSPAASAIAKQRNCVGFSCSYTHEEGFAIAIAIGERAANNDHGMGDA